MLRIIFFYSFSGRIEATIYCFRDFLTFKYLTDQKLFFTTQKNDINCIPLPSFSSLPPLPPINSFNESEDDNTDDNTDDDIDASFDNNSNRLVIPVLISSI